MGRDLWGFKDHDMLTDRTRVALRTCLHYASAAALWILISDWLVAVTVRDALLASRIQTSKGWMFVGVTTLLLYAALQSELRRWEREVRERERAQAELLRSNERFARAFNTSPAPLAITRMRDSTIVDANESFVRLLGYARDELVGRRTLALPLYADPTQHAEIVRLVGEGQVVREREVTIRTRAGEPRTMLASVELIELAGDECLLTFLTDVTELRRGAARARAHASRLQVLADASRAFAEASLDEPALIEQVARITAEALDAGCSVHLRSADGERLELAALAVSSSALRDAVRTLLSNTFDRIGDEWLPSRVLRGGQPLLIAHVDAGRLRAATQPQYWPLLDQLALHSLIIAPMRASGQGLGLLYVGRYQREQAAFDYDDLWLAQNLADRAALAISNARLFAQVQGQLAERTRAEGIIRQLNAELEERVAARTVELADANLRLRELNALKDYLLATTSHDLRSPLGVIQSMAELLMEERALPEDIRDLPEAIYSTARRMTEMVNRLLDLSRLEAGKVALEPVELLVSDVARQSLEMLAVSADAKALSLRLVVEPGEPPLEADWMRLSQIVTNLVSNAIKFTRPGGQVTVTVGPEPGGVRLQVADTGLGIPPDALPGLFDKFQQVHQRGTAGEGGSGLGLAIVRHLTELHGGSIEVASEVGRGSTFVVHLPGRRKM